MKPLTLGLWVAGSIGLGLGFSTLAVGQPAPPTEDAKRVVAQQAILQFGDHLTDKDVAEQAQAIVRQNASEDISSVFTVKTKGGLGIGKLTELGPGPDGIEKFLIRLQRRKTITEAEIEKYTADYLRVAKVMQAMAELAPYRATERVRKIERLSKEWNDVSHEFKEGAVKFRKAVEEKDPKKLRLAAGSMQNTCCHCHGLLD